MPFKAFSLKAKGLSHASFGTWMNMEVIMLYKISHTQEGNNLMCIANM